MFLQHHINKTMLILKTSSIKFLKGILEAGSFKYYSV